MTASLPASTRATAPPSPVIEVRDLRVATTGGQELVHGVGFELAPGRTLGIVGESGSGKTLTAMAVAGLAPPGVATSGGEIVVAGEDVTRRSRAVRRRLLKETFGVVFQNPTVSLNPRLTVGRQLREALPDDVRRSRARAWTRGVELLDRVGVPGAAGRLHAYPHELSGGLNQRIAIAIAIARSPRVLIADEATTALDVSVQKQVLDLVDELRRDLDLGVVLVSHDMGVVADRSDAVLVLRAGRAVEQGADRRGAERTSSRLHPRAPRGRPAAGRARAGPILEAERGTYPIRRASLISSSATRRSWLTAVDSNVWASTSSRVER